MAGRGAGGRADQPVAVLEAADEAVPLPQTSAQTATSSKPLSRMSVTSVPAATSGARAAPTERMAARASCGSLRKSGAWPLNSVW